MRIKVKELLDRSVHILEITKKDMDKYSEERHKVNYYMTHYNENIKIEDWEFYLEMLENKIKENS